MKRKNLGFLVWAFFLLMLGPAFVCLLKTASSNPTLMATMAPTATWTQIPPFPTGTPTAIPTVTPTPTLDTSGLVRLPGAQTFASLVAAEHELIRYARSLGVEKGTQVYLKVELADGVYVAVFGDEGGMWGLLETVPLTPTPTATPADGAEEAHVE